MPHVDPQRPHGNDRFVAPESPLRYHFAMPTAPFADELQKNWQLVSLTLRPTETAITVRTTVGHGVPDPVGRDGVSCIQGKFLISFQMH